MPKSLQLIGLCRFSYPSAEGSGFTTGATAPGAVPAVYDRHRLETRLWLFRNLCLPGLAAQTDPDFRLIILVGEAMPRFARAALDEMVAGHPQIIVQAEPEFQPHGEICARVLMQHRDPGAPFVAEFGMDDDDCVGVSFVAEVREVFAGLEATVRRERRVELDFCRGYALHVSAAGLAFKPVVAPHWNCAQVFLMPSWSRLSAFNFHHTRFWKRHMSISMARTPMFIRSFHDHNDSGDRWEKMKPEPEPKADLSGILTRHFALDLAALTQSLRDRQRPRPAAAR